MIDGEVWIWFYHLLFWFRILYPFIITLLFRYLMNLYDKAIHPSQCMLHCANMWLMLTCCHVSLIIVWSWATDYSLHIYCSSCLISINLQVVLTFFFTTCGGSLIRNLLCLLSLSSCFDVSQISKTFIILSIWWWFSLQTFVWILCLESEIEKLINFWLKNKFLENFG